MLKKQCWPMMRMWSCLSVFLLFLFYPAAATPSSQLHRFSESASRIGNNNNYLTKEELWFSQTLDHYSPYVLFSSLLNKQSISFLQFSLSNPVCRIIANFSSVTISSLTFLGFQMDLFFWSYVVNILAMG